MAAMAAPLRESGRHAPEVRGAETAPKRRYCAPHLKVWGDLRTVTLGPSPGIGESGNPAVFKVT